ncbi:MAG: hypothetical protein KH828_11005 [Clostridiales bacterium]|nr:hypothetical protein [Clostridiales bacterium]
MVAAVLIFWNIMQQSDAKKMIRIACVGDSITFGTGLEEREQNCYPVQLQKILGTKEYRVGNFGVGGATLQKEGDKPYWKEARYEQSRAYGADFVVLMLGTNDSKSINWKDEATFRKDYEEMVDSFEKLDPKPEMILATPPQLYHNISQLDENHMMQTEIIELERQIIMEVGAERKMKVLDLYNLTEGHPEWFQADGVHPNKEGAKKIAEAVEKQL